MNSKAEVLKLRSALASSEDKIHLLTHQLEEANTRLTEEVQQRDERLSSQGNELEAKANTVAVLTQQLYNAKIRLRNEIQAKSVASHVAPGGVCVCPHCHVHGSQPAVFTGVKSYALGNGREHGHTATTVAARPRVSGIQRRHFRNSSSPIAHDVSGLDCSVDHQNSGNKTGTCARRLPTPPLTPRPPPNDSQAPPTIRRASNPARRQSPSPKSSKNHAKIYRTNSLMKSNLTEEAMERSHDDQTLLSSLSAASVSSDRRELDPVHVHRQGVMPNELRELLQSREAERGGDLENLVSSRPAPLPPIASSGDETTPTQSDVIYNDPTATRESTFSELLPSRLRGQPPRQHRHFILAKAQGLSSAPSTMRVLRYPPQQQNLRGEGSGSGLVESKDVEIEDSSPETAEGTLLVKETIDRNDSALQELHYQR